MGVHFLVGSHVAQATLQLPKAWLPSMFQRVWLATPPHPYKPLGLCAGPPPHRQILLLDFWIFSIIIGM